MPVPALNCDHWQGHLVLDVRYWKLDQVGNLYFFCAASVAVLLTTRLKVCRVVLG